MYVCMYACPSIFSTAIHPIDFTLGGCVAEEPEEMQC